MRNPHLLEISSNAKVIIIYSHHKQVTRWAFTYGATHCLLQIVIPLSTGQCITLPNCSESLPATLATVTFPLTFETPDLLSSIATELKLSYLHYGASQDRNSLNSR